MLDLVWPGIAVEENSLTVAVAALRRALRDDAQAQRVIRTVSGRGYRSIHRAGRSYRVGHGDRAPGAAHVVAGRGRPPVAVAGKSIDRRTAVRQYER